MTGYHHGDLRHALIEATEAILAERGPQGFSLREVARRAGVSPAAPAHHFGDASGLLTAVATLAFDGLAGALRQAESRGGRDPRRRLREQGVGYVDYALRNPGKFRLMFGEALAADDEGLQRSGNAAFRVLEDGIRAAFALDAGRPLSAEAWTALLAVWSVVHGYAQLAIAGRLEPCMGGLALEAFAARSLPGVLDRVIEGCIPAKPPRPARLRPPAGSASRA